MSLDDAASASVACTDLPSQALSGKPVEGTPAASFHTPCGHNSTRTVTPYSSLYLSDTPALTVSSLPPSSPEWLQRPSHQVKQLGPVAMSRDTDEETDVESFEHDASIRPRRVMPDSDTLMAAEVLMRLSGRNDVNEPTGTPAFKVLGPASSASTNVPLRGISSQSSSPRPLHRTLAAPSLVDTRRPNTSSSATSASVDCLPLTSPFAHPPVGRLPVGSISDPVGMSPASSSIEATDQSVIEETTVVALAPLPLKGRPQSTPQVTKGTKEGVEEPKKTLKSQSRKRKRERSPAAVSQPASETKRGASKIFKTAKRRNVLSPTKKTTNKFKDTTTKSLRYAKKDPSLSPKSNAVSEGLVGHLITVLSLDGRSSLPFSKIVERVLESQPHLLDERPAAEWSELVKKTLNHSRNTMFGRAERKGLKVCSYASTVRDGD